MTARRRNVLLCVGGGLLTAIASVAGCTTTSLDDQDASASPTVAGVGLLPGERSTDPPASGVITVLLPHGSPGQIGATASGNRVILIGDSVMASISERYGGQACASLVPPGWQVELDAETGRFVEFGTKVLDERLDAGWDAAVILLGNNYLYDEVKYQAELHDLLTRLAPRPTVLLTTSLFRKEQLEVNRAIIAEGSIFPNVIVVDWAAITQESRFTGADHLHLTGPGRQRLASALAAVLGAAPGNDGKCLPTEFLDDSLGRPSATSVPTSNSTSVTGKTTTTTIKSTSTTVRSTTTTTNKPPKPTTTTSSSTTTTTQP